MTTAANAEHAAAMRRQSMLQDLQWIEAELERHGGNWDSWYDSLQPLRDDLNTKLIQAGGTLQKEDKFFYSMSALNFKLNMDDRGNTALEMLTFFNEQLRKKNIDLIVVPFPNRHNIIAEAFSDLVPADRIVQPYRLKFHQELLRRNIEVLNLAPGFLKMREQYSPLYYNCTDMHPADGAIRLTAKEIAARLARYGFRSSAKAKQGLRLVPGSFKIPPQYTLFPPGAEYRATTVQTADGKPVVLGLQNSPILVVGDSFIGVPTDYGLPGGDLLAHLSYLTGVFPSRIQGTASSILQVIARLGPNALKDVRVLVFTFQEDVMFGRNTGQFAYLFNWVMVDLP